MNHGGCVPARRTVGLSTCGMLLTLMVADPAAASFVTFESGQVRPLALSPNGSRLFAVNTPDGRLEIFDVSSSGLTHAGAVPVGMEPVAVAARTDGEVWVVNHLSDSVSIVDVSGPVPRVVRTLLVGDEPRDIVFGGTNKDRAFITTAHRGQNTPLHADIESILTQEGIGRADVWVFDVADLGSSMGGVPLTTVTLLGDTPRALAVTPDGSTVYAAVFHSGNQTTALNEGIVCNGGAGAGPCNLPDGGGQVPGGLPGPNQNIEGLSGPEVGLIVKFNQATGNWEDELGRDWSNGVRFDLPDLDVFAINADADPPVQTASFAHVGTVLFNMVVNPADPSKVYVSNTEARNEVRFEGDRTAPNTTDASTVRGHLHEARVTVLDGSTVIPRHLNKHINYTLATQPGDAKDDSLATPVGMAVTADGSTLYVAAFGSSKIGVFDTDQLETNTFVPDENNHIEVGGGGPSGLVLDEVRKRLYVLTRFDNAVRVIDTQTNSEVPNSSRALFNPEPPHVVNGRKFLYDARFTSSNGEASCSSCHVFADFDSLGWDLGNPDDIQRNNPNPQSVVPAQFAIHPMKGPMTTQTLRGMARNGPMHWRGDRSGGYAEPDDDNELGDEGGFNEVAAFLEFNVAFNGLLGRDEGMLAGADMQAFADFILEVTLPPNPIRNLNNSDTAAQARGRDFYMNRNPSDIVTTCNGCHELNPARGFFGTDGRTSFETETQDFKIPHLRNQYQKVGMFGMPNMPALPGSGAHTGDQVRGFGFLHDGAVDTVFRFHSANVFAFNDDGERRDMEAFMFAFDTNLAPIVGQQVTLGPGGGIDVGARIDLLIARSAVGECDLIVKGAVAEEGRGWLRTATGEFRSDRSDEPLLTDDDLRALATTAGQELTYTCVPPGSGQRMGIDRDEDGILDRDEGLCTAAPTMSCRAAGKSIFQLKTQSGREKLAWKWGKGQTEPDDLGDPRTAETAYSLCVYTGTANGLVMEVEVPPQGTCDGAPCWNSTGSVLKYRDKSLRNDGAQLVQVKAAAGDRAKALVKGKGSNLPLPTIPSAGLPLPLTVQLMNSDGACWEATYTTATTNAPEGFKAKY